MEEPFVDLYRWAAKLHSCRTAGELKTVLQELKSSEQLSSLVNLDTARDYEGRTALHRAAISGNNELLEALLSEGASPGIVDSTGNCPLYYAASTGNVQAVKLLLEYGATDESDSSAMANALQMQNERNLYFMRCSTLVLPVYNAFCIRGRDEFYNLATTSTIQSEYGVRTGKWYYEVQLLSAGAMQIGWAVINAKAQPSYHGVGDWPYSWGFDGYRKMGWNTFQSYRLSSDVMPSSWRAGDVIGCGIDLDTYNIYYWHNGRPLGAVFERINQRLTANMAYDYKFYAMTTLGLFQAAAVRTGTPLTPLVYAAERAREGFQPLAALQQRRIETAYRAQGLEDIVPLFPQFREPPIPAQQLALSNAVVADSLEVVRVLLAYRLHPDMEDLHGCTAVHLAAYFGRVDILRALLKYDARIQKPDKFERTPLHWAAMSCFHDNAARCAKELLRIGAATAVFDSGGLRPLHVAALSANRPVLEVLLKYGDPIDALDAGGNTALSYACQCGHADLVEFLLARGARADHVSPKSGLTPLHLAAGACDADARCLQLLLDKNATDSNVDIDIDATSQGSSAIMHAAVVGHAEGVRLLAEYGAALDVAGARVPLVTLAVASNIATLEACLDCGAPIGEPPVNELHPLAVAAEQGNCAAVRLLAPRVPQLVNRRVAGDRLGRYAPLHAAAMADAATVRELLRCGADINAEATMPDGLSMSVLHMAARASATGVVTVLIDEGKMDPEIIDSAGATPLYAALRHGHMATVRELIRRNARVERWRDLYRQVSIEGCPHELLNVFGAVIAPLDLAPLHTNIATSGAAAFLVFGGVFGEKMLDERAYVVTIQAGTCMWQTVERGQWQYVGSRPAPANWDPQAFAEQLRLALFRRMSGATATLLGGLIYVFGGLRSNLRSECAVFDEYGPLNDLYVIEALDEYMLFRFDCPITSTTAPPPRFSHTTVAFGRHLVVFGGFTGSEYLGDLWVLNVDTMTWSQPAVTGTPPSPRALHTATIVGDRYMYVFGGYDRVLLGGIDQAFPSDTALYVLDCVSWNWSVVTPAVDSGPPPAPRGAHTAVYVPQPPQHGVSTPRSAQAADPTVSHPSGRLLIIGGNDSMAVLHEIYEFDLAATRWRRLDLPPLQFELPSTATVCNYKLIMLAPGDTLELLDIGLVSPFTEYYASLVGDATFSDIKFVFPPSEHSTMRELPAHKVILASRCKKLREFLTQNPTVTEIPVPEGISPLLFQKFVMFLYSNYCGPEGIAPGEIGDWLALGQQYLSGKKLDRLTECAFRLHSEPVDQSLARAFAKTINQSTFADLKLWCGGRTLYVHKVMMSRCEYFRRMFHGEFWREGRGETLNIADVSYRVLHKVVEWIYCGTLTDLPAEMASELLDAVERYGLPDLKVKCEQEITRILSDDNVLSWLEEADLYRASNLRAACLLYIGKRVAEVQPELNLVQLTRTVEQLPPLTADVTVVPEEITQLVETFTRLQQQDKTKEAKQPVVTPPTENLQEEPDDTNWLRQVIACGALIMSLVGVLMLRN